MLYPLYHRIFGKEFCNLSRIFAMSFHTESKSFHTKVGKECVFRAHNSAKVTHHLNSALNAEGAFAKGCVNKSVIAFVGNQEFLVSVSCGEIEITAVNNTSAESYRVAVKILGGGIYYDIGSEVKGTEQNGSNEGVVNNERDEFLNV